MSTSLIQLAKWVYKALPLVVSETRHVLFTWSLHKMAAVQSEVAKGLDLEVLRYSKVWEDHRVLEEGLDICDNDVVLSITR